MTNTVDKVQSFNSFVDVVKSSYPTELHDRINKIAFYSQEATKRPKEKKSLDSYTVEPYFVGGDDLINICTALGYKGCERGACFGLGWMGIQAILAEDVETFDLRLSEISQLLDQCKTESELVHGLKKDVNTLAFFDGIAAYHSDFPLLFSMKRPQMCPDRIRFLSKLLLPKRLEDSRKSIVILDKITGIYQENELLRYFSALKQLAQKGSPLAFLLIGKDHAASIGYDPKNDQWLFIESSLLLVRRIRDTELLTFIINLALGDIEKREDLDRLTMTTVICSTGATNPRLNKQLKAWKNTRDFKEIHQPSAEKTKNGSWLCQALHMYDSYGVLSLLDAGCDPNLGILQAIYTQNVEGLRLLLKRGGNPNLFVEKEKTTPLLMAVYLKSPEMIHVLLEAGANPNLPCGEDKGTPLSVALSLGDHSVIEALSRKASKL